MKQEKKNNVKSKMQFDSISLALNQVYGSGPTHLYFCPR